jgi:uncharacterized membrane protein YbhN (UPF0104 family)
MLKTLNFKNLFNILLGVFFFILSINYFYDYNFISQNILNSSLLNLHFFFGFIFFLGHILLNFYRWNLILKNNQNIKLNYKVNFIPFFSMIFINFIIPFKIGDLYRIFATKFISKKDLITSIIFERLMDIFFVLLILYFGIILFLLRINLEYLIYFFLISIVFLLIIFYIIIISRNFKKLEYFRDIIINLFLKLKINIISIIFVTFLSWLSEIIFFYIVFKKIFFDFSMEEILISHSSSILAIILPSGPGLIGPVDFTINEIMSFYGHSAYDISIFIYLFHIFIFIVCFKIFIIFLFIYPYKLIKMKLLK